MSDIELPDFEDIEFTPHTVDDLHQYDKVPCDECGEIIESGQTRLYTGQVVHHGCADQ